jgi:cytochrome c oxidase subunit 1
MMNDALGKVNFWTLFVGFNVTFFPMHFLVAMPRRVYTYPESTGWGPLNLLSTGGALLLLVGGAMLVYNIVRSYTAGEVAPDNPWNADTLEWGTSSPPPVYNFLHIPVVEGRNALWDRSPDAPVVVGLRSECREVLLTSVLDAAPNSKTEFPEPNIWPFLCAVVTAAFFVGSVFTPWALPVSVLPIAATLILWFWPEAPGRGRSPHQRAVDEAEARA